MNYSLNSELAFAQAPLSIHILFGVHIILFLLTIICGFMAWTVIRLTDSLHTPINCVIAGWAAVNCVLGSASVSTGIVNLAGNGYWRYGRESCILLHSLDTALQCGAIWALASLLIYTSIQFTEAAVYARCISSFKRLIPTMVWCGAIAQGFIAMFISNGAFYTSDKAWPFRRCTNNASTKANAIFMTASSFVIPTAIIVGLYAWLIMRRHRPLTRQVRPEVGMATNTTSRRSFGERRDMDVAETSPPGSGQCQDRPPAMRSLSKQDLRVNGRTSLGSPNCPSLNPQSLTSVCNSLTARTGGGLSQLIEDSPRKRLKSASLGELDFKTDVTLKKVRRNSAFFHPGSLPKLPALKPTEQLGALRGGAAPSFLTSRNVVGSAEPDLHQRGTKDQQIPDGNEKEVLRGPGAGASCSVRAQAVLEKAEPDSKKQKKARNTNQTARFLHQREDFLRDTDDWPTVFLTAETVDQEDCKSSSPRDHPPHSASSVDCRPGLFSTRSPGPGGNMSGHVFTGKDATQLDRSGNESRIGERLKSFLLLVIPHSLLWLPHHIMLIMVMTDTIDRLSFNTYALIETIGKFSLVLNPSLYLISCKEFRKSLCCILRYQDPNYSKENDTKQDRNSSTAKQQEYDVENYKRGNPQTSNAVSDSAPVYNSAKYLRKPLSPQH